MSLSAILKDWYALTREEGKSELFRTMPGQKRLRYRCHRQGLVHIQIEDDETLNRDVFDLKGEEVSMPQNIWLIAVPHRLAEFIQAQLGSQYVTLGKSTQKGIQFVYTGPVSGIPNTGRSSDWYEMHPNAETVAMSTHLKQQCTIS